MLRQSAILIVVFAVLTCGVYPLAVFGIGQAFFHSQADGSMVSVNGRTVGSSLIGQQFTTPGYFHGRPSETLNVAGTAGQPYDAANSGASNLGPNSPVLIALIRRRVDEIRRQNPRYSGAIPVDMVTADFSGLDPDISPASAYLQVSRVAAARHMSSSAVRSLVTSQIRGRVLGIFGEPFVNVLDLNIALDEYEASHGGARHS